MSLKPRLSIGAILVGLDLAGTALFAVQGAAVAIAAHLDLLGVLVFSFLSSAGGGILRDVIIGAVPPAGIRNWRYLATALVAGSTAFLLHRMAPPLPALALATLDAAGLAFYSTAGALKALEFGLHPLPAVLMAGLTGVGGGVIRDVLRMEVPVVLRADFYASAAIIGGTVTVLVLRSRASSSGGTKLAMWCGIVTCFTLRMLAVAYHWHLPSF